MKNLKTSEVNTTPQNMENIAPVGGGSTPEQRDIRLLEQSQDVLISSNNWIEGELSNPKSLHAIQLIKLLHANTVALLKVTVSLSKLRKGEAREKEVVSDWDML